MNKVQLKLTFLLLFGAFYFMEGQAQTKSKSEQRTIARQAIKDLKGGTLIIRLNSKRKKIEKLEELLGGADLEEKFRKRLSNELKKTIEERNHYNLSLSNAFDQYYSFSNIYYMYDSASISLRNGQRKGIFLDKKLEEDSDIEIPEGPFFVIKVGSTDLASTTGIQALVMMTAQLEDLARPFPYYVRLNSISRLFTRIFNHKNLVKKDAKEIVQRLNQNLLRYHEQVTIGR